MLISLILCFLNLKVLGGIIAILSFIYFLLAINTKVFKLTGRISYKLLFKLFGRYGKVVSAKDWKNIKVSKNKLYRFLTTKKSMGTCYFSSWAIARFLQDAQIMYCSIEISGRPSGHAVIIKDNCIYDTNNRRHWDYDEYIKFFDVNVYKMFSKNEYDKESFFDDIRDGFVEWCRQNDTYCDPQ